MDLVLESPEGLSLSGRKAEATMFFSDLAGFTSISEKLGAEELAQLLNRYLTPMTDIILEEDGYLDKYSGDGIMAVWGVPYPDPDHALKACRAALRQQDRLRELAAEIKAELGIEISVRMGINSGQVSAGNMGSERKMQYTVMGDPVNLAARLEPANKDYGTCIILAEETKKRLPETGPPTRLLDKMVVKGKTEPVLIYELLPGPIAPLWVPDYEAGLRKLWSRDWDGASELFQRVLSQVQDVAAQGMLERIALYRREAPPPDWDGAHVRKFKD
ncbi:MAG: adenylate/guanylate cyclase domain-containing protein [Blastochloris sp.]|nr:adenylate/guanylate cyclase domain-containing protein [Blastochloris sp.]